MNNIVWHNHKVSKQERTALKQHKPAVLWFTGLSGSGKSTVAGCLEELLHQNGVHTYLLDGDNIRHGLCGDLGFSDKDRVENIRRIGEVTKLFVDAGVMVLTAFISPFRADRQMVRQLQGEGEFIEVFVDAPLEVCEERDPKGLYKKARKGDIPNFTGIDSEYEAPEEPEITVKTAEHGVEACAEQLFDYLKSNGYLPAAS
ncbi:adenylyl-sulfate kinase [Corallincola platygyrae]|uniref:Adenylyl-sulfate kinase n=1 Tax=Corallincola platygyrae TaxID=1193278 RepID=A0ABW4XSM9_9GAMM